MMNLPVAITWVQQRSFKADFVLFISWTTCLSQPLFVLRQHKNHSISSINICLIISFQGRTYKMLFSFFVLQFLSSKIIKPSSIKLVKAFMYLWVMVYFSLSYPRINKYLQAHTGLITWPTSIIVKFQCRRNCGNIDSEILSHYGQFKDK